VPDEKWPDEMSALTPQSYAARPSIYFREKWPDEMSALTPAAFAQRVSRIHDNLVDHDVFFGEDAAFRVRNRCLIVSSACLEVRALFGDFQEGEWLVSRDGKILFYTSDWISRRSDLRRRGLSYRCWLDVLNAIKATQDLVMRRDRGKLITDIASLRREIVSFAPEAPLTIKAAGYLNHFSVRRKKGSADDERDN
jgi:hypothetical protein